MPEQPPEARLIEAARRGLGLSIRSAAKRAGISESQWRRIELGRMLESAAAHVAYQGTADMVARMALAVRVSAASLRKAGREDAAAALAGMGEMELPEAARMPGDLGAVVHRIIAHIETDPDMTAARKHHMRLEYLAAVRDAAERIGREMGA